MLEIVPSHGLHLQSWCIQSQGRTPYGTIPTIWCPCRLQPDGVLVPALFRTSAPIEVALQRPGTNRCKTPPVPFMTGTKNLQMGGGVVVVNFIGSLSQQVVRVVWPPIIESPFVHYGRLVSTRLSIGTSKSPGQQNSWLLGIDQRIMIPQ